MSEPGQCFDVVESCKEFLREDDEISIPIAAMLSLTKEIEYSKAGTMFELVNDINSGKEKLKNSSISSIGLDAGAELFSAFVTSLPHNSTDFHSLKEELVREGRRYADQSKSCRSKICDYAMKFIKDGAVILTHSYSRVVLQVLLLAHQSKRITVYVTEARPSCEGVKMVQSLQSAGIPSFLTLDSGVGYIIDKVDMVLVGSEVVLESGGLVNAIGSYQMALIAKAAHKPFYAAAESFKFHRLFPLSQYDLPCIDQSGNVEPAIDNSSMAVLSALERLPKIDYTSPDLISLVFSDVGVLTPSGVSQYLVGMFAG